MLRTLKSKQLFWGLVLSSLGLHGAVLALPWPNRSLSPSQIVFDDAALDRAQPPAINITILPETTISSVESKTDSVEPYLSAIPAPQPAPVVTAPIVSPAQTQPIQPPQSPELLQQPQTVQPEPTPAIQPEVESSQSQFLSDTEETDVEDGNSEETPTSAALNQPLDTSPEQGIVVRLGDDFPDLAGAQSGCYGLENCRQISGNFRQMAQQLVSQMEEQGYELTEREDIDNTGHRVFEVSNPNDPSVTHYLNVFSPDIGSAVYVLTVDILSLEELKQLNG